MFPEYATTADDPFLASVQASGRAWVLLAPPEGAPTLALDADGFLRAARFESTTVEPWRFCHQPIAVRDRHADLGATLSELEAESGEDVIARDVILLWGEEKRIITGTDILERWRVCSGAIVWLESIYLPNLTTTSGSLMAQVCSSDTRNGVGLSETQL